MSPDTRQDPQREQLSAFLDGELSRPEAQVMAAHASSDRSLSRDLRAYSLIGDVLRSVEPVPAGQRLSMRIAEALAHEPAYLAPRHTERRERRALMVQEGRTAQRNAAWVASAAALAFVAVVSWAVGTSSGQDQVAAAARGGLLDDEFDEISLEDDQAAKLLQAHLGGSSLLRPVESKE